MKCDGCGRKLSTAGRFQQHILTCVEYKKQAKVRQVTATISSQRANNTAIYESLDMNVARETYEEGPAHSADRWREDDMLRYVPSRKDRAEVIKAQDSTERTNMKVPEEAKHLRQDQVLIPMTDRDDDYDYDTLKEHLMKISLDYDEIDHDEVDKEMETMDKRVAEGFLETEAQAESSPEPICQADGSDLPPTNSMFRNCDSGLYAQRKQVRDRPWKAYVGGPYHRDDPFHPKRFDEAAIPHYEKPHPHKAPEISRTALAQLDLLIILRNAGCPLYLHDEIIKWMEFHSNNDTKDDKVFDRTKFRLRETLLRFLEGQTTMSGRAPTVKDIALPSDSRLISLSKFSFMSEFLSIFHNDDLMQERNFVEGYDIATGQPSGDGVGDFWKHSSIKPNKMMHIPDPTDGDRPMNHLYCGTKFQLSRDRFCTESHHMPVPLVLFYDESHLDRNGVLTNAPMFFTIGWFNHFCRARIDFWRVLSIVPHLGLGSGKSSSKTATDKAKDHHFVLREVFEEFEYWCKTGGVWVTFGGKRRLLKFWIHTIIGDTKGHNQLCGKYEKSTCHAPMRACKCAGPDLDILPLKCESVTIGMLHDARSEDGEIGRLCYRDMDNCFDHLPMGHPTRGIMACCNFEPLHVIDVGLYKYMSDTLWDGMKGNKQDREKFDLLFRTMSKYMERQSETDMARRGCKWELTDDTRFTAMERLGNTICMVVCLHTHDGETLLKKSFEDVRKGWVKGIIDALVAVLTYERWILQEGNTADEIVRAAAHVNKSLDLVLEHLPREKGNKWSIPKVHGYIHMYYQVMEDGPGNGWTGQHGEGFHREVTNGAVNNTQKRHETVCKQLSDRIHENRVMDEAATVYENYISASTINRTFVDTSEQPKRTTREDRSYTRNLTQDDYVGECNVVGKYEMYVPSESQVKNTQDACWRTTWRDRYRRKNKISLDDSLKFALRQYATKRAWEDGFHVTGFTCMKKLNPSTGLHTRYRSDPDFYGDKWNDWCTVHFNEGVCPALILGFVRFDNDGFPTPCQVRCTVGEDAKQTLAQRRNLLKEIDKRRDTRVYVVVRCAEKSLKDLKYDDNFVTRFRLLGKESVWIKPIEEVIGPLMVVPSIQSVLYMGESEWLLVRPMRVWGDWFGNKILKRSSTKLSSTNSRRKRQGTAYARDQASDGSGSSEDEDGAVVKKRLHQYKNESDEDVEMETDLICSGRKSGLSNTSGENREGRAPARKKAASTVGAKEKKKAVSEVGAKGNKRKANGTASGTNTIATSQESASEARDKRAEARRERLKNDDGLLV